MTFTERLKEQVIRRFLGGQISFQEAERRYRELAMDESNT